MRTFTILLRTPDSSTIDKYEAAFNVSGQQYKAVCVPVLETVLMNLEELKQTIISGPKVDGVVMTSARSCEAWKTSIAQCPDEQTVMKLWSNIPFYVVGAATAASLRDIYSNPDQIRGEHSGTAEQLARFILDESQGHPPKCLLYLVGDKNRDTLPKLMDEGHVGLASLQVYETCGSSKFPADLSEALKGREKDDDFWIVFFAPSAAAFVFPYLQMHFRFRTIDTSQLSTDDRSLVRIAAIGPTTASFLRDNLHLHVDAMPSKPNPESLSKVIQECLYT
ncbi:tetrapyrrole biosynthesis uroporphyrinogen III synthase [Lentinula detonsa]|uniref:Tetrapyrrole biosynthesis uroporphyrinogen III synthase n=1 Tax=Lentinula detonsa TaxID=2804962 RepID=A0AA38Q3Z6_9AGAR|nr:tetrapyrrole biosynthesis uroporphyrinogen III synthase [Lentinula detonsa]